MEKCFLIKLKKIILLQKMILNSSHIYLKLRQKSTWKVKKISILISKLIKIVIFQINISNDY